MSAIYRTDVLWDEWYDQQATSDEKEIYDLIWQHKHFFDDLTLQKGSSTFSIFEDDDRPDLQLFYFLSPAKHGNALLIPPKVLYIPWLKTFLAEVPIHR